MEINGKTWKYMEMNAINEQNGTKNKKKLYIKWSLSVICLKCVGIVESHTKVGRYGGGSVRMQSRKWKEIFGTSQDTSVPYVLETLEPWNHHGIARSQIIRQLKIFVLHCELDILKNMFHRF